MPSKARSLGAKSRFRSKFANPCLLLTVFSPLLLGNSLEKSVKLKWKKFVYIRLCIFGECTYLSKQEWEIIRRGGLRKPPTLAGEDMGTGRIIVPNRPITMHIQTPFDVGKPTCDETKVAPKKFGYTARKKNGVSSFGILEACLSPPPKKRADKNFLSQKAPPLTGGRLVLYRKKSEPLRYITKGGGGGERRALAPLRE